MTVKENPDGKKLEKISKEEWKRMMTDKPTYKRVNGRVRQK